VHHFKFVANDFDGNELFLLRNTHVNRLDHAGKDAFAGNVQNTVPALDYFTRFRLVVAFVIDRGASYREAALNSITLLVGVDHRSILRVA